MSDSERAKLPTGHPLASAEPTLAGSVEGFGSQKQKMKSAQQSCASQGAHGVLTAVEW